MRARVSIPLEGYNQNINFVENKYWRCRQHFTHIHLPSVLFCAIMYHQHFLPFTEKNKLFYNQNTSIRSDIN